MSGKKVAWTDSQKLEIAEFFKTKKYDRRFFAGIFVKDEMIRAVNRGPTEDQVHDFLVHLRRRGTMVATEPVGTS